VSGETVPDPTGKQALFSSPLAAAPDREGKDALFSMSPWRPGTVVVECSVCKVRRRASLLEVGMRLVMGSLWFPWGKHPHWMSCASCGRRQWCRIGWTE
jgi:hypothetical protein